MQRLGFRTIAAVAFAVTVGGVSLAGCGSSGGSSASGSVTITVNCEPPVSQAPLRSRFVSDIASFEKLHPDIHIVPKDAFPCDDPQTFDAKLAGGQMENVFYVYYTDTANVIASGQAADITTYLGTGTQAVKDLQPSLAGLFKDAQGHVYGLPKTNYTMGLLYSRKLFTEAGLNPDSPPATWAGVRADATKIAALGHGIAGYGDYDIQGQGGWHFTAEMYAQGGAMVVRNGGKNQVGFSNASGQAVLQNLHDMRWADHSMPTKPAVQIADLQQLMASGKLGMYISAPDNIPTIVAQYQGTYADYGMGPMPGPAGHGTLLGGDGYMFSVKDTPAQIRAGIQWLEYENLTPASGQFNWAALSALKQPVGLPEPDVWTAGSASATTDDQARAKYANMPIQNYAPYKAAAPGIAARIEPPQAQQIYSVLDTAMSAVLTSQGANISQLLSQAQQKVNTLLANASNG
jgi:multiple sugar transport system substrate-binding protein